MFLCLSGGFCDPVCMHARGLVKPYAHRLVPLDLWAPVPTSLCQALL